MYRPFKVSVLSLFRQQIIRRWEHHTWMLMLIMYRVECRLLSIQPEGCCWTNLEADQGLQVRG